MTQWKRKNPTRLTPSQVEDIRLRYAAGHTYREIAAVYRVATETVGRIIRGETWQPAEYTPLTATPPPVNPDLNPFAQNLQARDEANMTELGSHLLSLSQDLAKDEARYRGMDLGELKAMVALTDNPLAQRILAERLAPAATHPAGKPAKEIP